MAEGGVRSRAPRYSGGVSGQGEQVDTRSRGSGEPDGEGGRDGARLGRLDEPIQRATRLTQKTLESFPVRVWRHFLQHNGFLLAAGISYQALFTVFAAIYIAAAMIGLWLGGNQSAVDGLIDVINSYVPGLIGDDGGLIERSQVQDVASRIGGVLTSITSVVALGVLIWTAIGFVTYTRRAVRDTFGLPYDSRNALLLKAGDLAAAVLFGLALLAGWVLVQITTWALHLLMSLLPWGETTTSSVLVRVLTLIVAFGVNALALALLYRFLTGTSLLWRRILPGSLLGGAALALLQIGAGLVLGYSPSNPLLATFAIFVGFLLWFRLNGVVILVSAAWIAISTSDRDIPLVELTAEERERMERRALRITAEVRLREAEEAAARAPWWSAPVAARRVRTAQKDLERTGTVDTPTTDRSWTRLLD